MGRGGVVKISRKIFCRRSYLSSRKGKISSENPFRDGSSSKKTVEEQKQALPEEEHGIFNQKREGNNRLSSEGFFIRPLEGSSRKTYFPRSRETVRIAEEESEGPGFPLSGWSREDLCKAILFSPVMGSVKGEVSSFQGDEGLGGREWSESEGDEYD